jgi:toxin-antitoxin system PIN domain toxin
MIAVDTNILVYAHRRDSAFHQGAAAALRSLAEGRSVWAIPWPCVHEFLAVVTHPRIYQPPTPMEGALSQVAAWLDAPTLVMLSEGMDHWAVLSELCASAEPVGGRVHDARVAAICLAAGVRELWSADRDFSRFPIEVRNPIVS